MENIKEIVDVWELRVAIGLSMVLQILLILWPYLVRPSSSRPWLRIIWLFVYVAVDFVATLCLGIIFHVYMDPKHAQADQNNKFLLAIWAPIILLHLAAHSTVTAFSLEDNSMWVSHVFRFVFRLATASSIFAMALQDTRLRYPSAVLLVVSSFKFMERVWTLKRGSMEELRMSTFREAGPFIRNRDIIGALSLRIQAANNRGDLLLPAAGARRRINVPRHHAAPPRVPTFTRDSEVQTLCAAYRSFNKYKGLYVQSSISPNEHEIEENGQPFRGLRINDATKLMEMELGFAYDFFYTKRVFFHSLWCWSLRLIAMLLLLSVLFALVGMDKQGFLDRDVTITYVFVIVTLILEVMSFLDSLASNCTIVQVGFEEGRTWRKIEGWVRGLRSMVSKMRTSRQSSNIKMGQFSMLSFCHADFQSWNWVKPVLNFLQLKELWDNFWYTRYETLDDHADLRTHIFNRVTTRLQEEDAANSSFSAPIGASVKRMLGEPPTQIIQKNLREDLGECVIVWHLATEKCCRDLQQHLPHLLGMAKHVSDYMLYLLAVQPSMLSKLTTAEITSYKNACAALTDSYSILHQGELAANSAGEDAAIVALLEDIHNILDEGSREQRNRRKAVRLVLDGFELAEELKELMEENNNGDDDWELVLQLWVDLLSFAAYHSQGEHHAKQLGSGGEFLTNVWLFMVHFIWQTCYQVEPQNAGRPLV